MDTGFGEASCPEVGGPRPGYISAWQQPLKNITAHITISMYAGWVRWSQVLLPRPVLAVFNIVCCSSLLPWKFPSTSMEAPINFRGSFHQLPWKLPPTSMEASTNLHGNRWNFQRKLRRKHPSSSPMEASIYFHGIINLLPSNSMESSLYFHASFHLLTSMELDPLPSWMNDNFHGSSSSFPWRTLAKYSSKSSRAASVTTAKGEASYRRSSVDLDPTGRWSSRCSWSDACRNWR